MVTVELCEKALREPARIETWIRRDRLANGTVHLIGRCRSVQLPEPRVQRVDKQRQVRAGEAPQLVAELPRSEVEPLRRLLQERSRPVGGHLGGVSLEEPRLHGPRRD